MEEPAPAVFFSIKIMSKYDSDSEKSNSERLKVFRYGCARAFGKVIKRANE